MTGLRRHALVRLSQPPETGVAEDRDRAARWQAAGRPFVIARGGEDPSSIAVGFCSVEARFPQLRPRRVAARTTAAAILDLRRPPALREIADCAAARPHAAAFARLAAMAEAAGLDLRVYGSWMWQALTGEAHVRPGSDLDLLVDVADGAGANRAVSFLAEAEAGLPFRLDGELSIAGHGEVQWREFGQGAPEVAVKSVGGLRLMPRAALGA
ncbi:malonate decarboxylase holo-[acyl-carrier-protein] synthase [Reyranella sp.]|uniref:malonate decarboxylase holo-[acyl-carrier-protein] synthase n=1 Tax=Reyranella sp. TaxID=1929291 RepID=UPI003BA84F9C